MLCYLFVNVLINQEWVSAYTKCVIRTGSILKCNETEPHQCSDVKGYTMGWCNDDVINGPLPGNIDGPIGMICRDWIWSAKQCPPTHCVQLHPDPLKRKFGWCATTKTSMKGESCGPFKPNTCAKWVWDPTQCSTKCARNDPPIVKKNEHPIMIPNRKAHKKLHQKGCKLKCGKMKDGEVIKCPPPNCDEPSCSLTCGRMKNGQVQCPPPPCSGGKQCLCKGGWVKQRDRR